MRAASVPRAGGGAGPGGGEPLHSLSPSSPAPPPLSAAPAAALLGLETPVVVVRLPGKRPRARPWSQAEEARLTRVCQDCWPGVDWPSVAQEVGHDIRDCISQSTMLHLQELARGEAPASPPQPPPPPQSQPAPSGEEQQQQQQHEGSLPTLTTAAKKGSEDEDARMASGSMHRRGISSSSSISSSVTNNLLPSEVAALALQHQFDWAAVGKALKADPWECWKTYETYSQDKTSPNSDSPLFSGPTHGHGPTPISSLADDVAAFLPFASSPSPLRRNPLAPPYDILQHYHPPDLSSFTAATAAAAAAATTAGDGENRSSSNTISNPISPPPPVLSPPVGTGGPSFLHHFPRPNLRARLPLLPHAPASSTTATTTTTTPAASFLRSFSASSFQQPGVSPGGGGEGGGRGEGQLQPHPLSLPAGLQDSAYSTFSGMDGGGGGGSTFLPGSDSMSLSMLQSAMLDMPSLYFGQSTAFGSGASTFFLGGGGGGLTIVPATGGGAAGAAGAAGGGGVAGGGDGLDGLLPPFPPPTAPPFVSSSPMLQPLSLPRGLGGPMPAVIPATIMEGSGTAEAGGSSISDSNLKQSETTTK